MKKILTTTLFMAFASLAFSEPLNAPLGNLNRSVDVTLGDGLTPVVDGLSANQHVVLRDENVKNVYIRLGQSNQVGVNTENGISRLPVALQSNPDMWFFGSVNSDPSIPSNTLVRLEYFNANHWGAELSFADAVTDDGIIFKVCKGSTGFDTGRGWDVGGFMRAQFESAWDDLLIEAANRGWVLNVVSVSWDQGEDDSKGGRSATYQASLEAFITYVEAYVSADPIWTFPTMHPELPIAERPEQAVVRAAKDTIVAANDDYFRIDRSDLTDSNNSDGTHFNDLGLITSGYREAIFSRRGISLAVPVYPPASSYGLRCHIPLEPQIQDYAYNENSIVNNGGTIGFTNGRVFVDFEDDDFLNIDCSGNDTFDVSTNDFSVVFYLTPDSSLDTVFWDGDSAIHKLKTQGNWANGDFRVVITGTSQSTDFFGAQWVVGSSSVSGLRLMVFTCDRSEDDLKFYIDGVDQGAYSQFGPVTDTSTLDVDNTVDYLLGKRWNTTGAANYDGSVYYFDFYDRVIPQDEVQKMFRNISTGHLPIRLR